LTGFYPLAKKQNWFNSYGSHGISGIEEVLIGSNTEKVVRLSEVPVLVSKKTQLNWKEQILFSHLIFERNKTIQNDWV
jgi:hypothetical protein